MVMAPAALINNFNEYLENIFYMFADDLGNMVAEIYPYDEWGEIFPKENIDIHGFPIFY